MSDEARQRRYFGYERCEPWREQDKANVREGIRELFATLFLACNRDQLVESPYRQMLAAAQKLPLMLTIPVEGNETLRATGITKRYASLATGYWQWNETYESANAHGIDVTPTIYFPAEDGHEGNVLDAESTGETDLRISMQFRLRLLAILGQYAGMPIEEIQELTAEFVQRQLRRVVTMFSNEMPAASALMVEEVVGNAMAKLPHRA